MQSSDLGSVVEYLKVLAHESRLRLLGLLAARERSVGELAELLELKEPTVSHHLAKLADVGLVTMRAEGTTHRYRLDSEALQELSRDLFTSERMASFSPEHRVDAYEKKVLRTYLDAEGRLNKIPQTRKKRDVILRWLVTRFERGRRYPESEVNEMIGEAHSDFATLRRELIMARLMDREAGVYWRIDEGAVAV